MKNRCVKFISIILLGLSLIACTGEHESTPLYGAPTTIAKSESPIDVVCRIQAEFKRLEKPLMKSMSYQSAWKSWKFGAAPVNYPGYHKVLLTDAGLEFLQKHSRLELVLSLTPLFSEAEIGGEAATLLAGIPAGNKSVQGGKTAGLASALDESFYRSPTRPGRWFDKVENYYARSNTLYGHINKTESIHRKRAENLEKSLEAKIIEQLDKYGNAPFKIFNERPYMPQPHDVERIRQWIANNKAPQLNEPGLNFINRDDALFSALALFPLLPSPNQSGLNRDQILMMYMLGLEDQYWPAMMQLSSGQKEINQLRNKFKQQLPKLFANLCNRKSNEDLHNIN